MIRSNKREDRVPHTGLVKTLPPIQPNFQEIVNYKIDIHNRYHYSSREYRQCQNLENAARRVGILSSLTTSLNRKAQSLLSSQSIP